MCDGTQKRLRALYGHVDVSVHCMDTWTSPCIVWTRGRLRALYGHVDVSVHCMDNMHIQVIDTRAFWCHS
jgi:hypothetical protein